MHAYLCSIWFTFVLWCEVVSPCYRRWCNNLYEHLDPFPFLGGCWIKRRPGLRLICRWPSYTGHYWLGIPLHPTLRSWYSQIFVQKRDVKHKLTISAVFQSKGTSSVSNDFWKISVRKSLLVSFLHMHYFFPRDDAYWCLCPLLLLLIYNVICVMRVCLQTAVTN